MKLEVLKPNSDTLRRSAQRQLDDARILEFVTEEPTVTRQKHLLRDHAEPRLKPSNRLPEGT